MSKNLFEGSSESETEINEFKTNREYAKSYNKFREKELMKRLKDLDKNNSSGSSSDEDSDSTDEEVVINKKFDEEFYKTLSSLKSRNPEIYDKNKRFFENISSDNEDNDNKKEKKQKAVTIKDYERKVILEKGGKYVDDDDSDTGEVDDDDPRAGSPSYMQEQKKLRSEIKKALASDEEDEEEFGGIFRKRDKTKEDKLKEEEEYSVWLAGEKDEIAEDAAKVLNPLKEYWSNPSLPKQEQFLRDYILNNGYQDKDEHEIPTYNEIVGDFSDDEKELEKQAEFELKYNFRYEDPDKEFIKRYPRTIESSVRQSDDRRKEKRVEVKERKEKEKEQKFKELEMLKEIKRKEILEKIEKLKEVTGNDELAFKEDELDEDFDPDAHDKRMQAIFNDEYYGVDEGEDKPECPDVEELKLEDWDNYDPANVNGGGDDDYEPHCDDENFNMDCDHDPQAAKESLQNELIESTKGRRKRRRNQFKEMIDKEKPVFNPEDERTYGDYIDEYYKLDCEDMIGDTPCRFKYVETTPNDFGLTIEEILLAKNKELNQWVSLKKAVQIRPAHVELRDKKLYKMKAKNETLKKKIFRSIYGSPSDEEGENEDVDDNTIGTKRKADDTESQNPAAKKKKNKNKKRKLESETQTTSNGKSETKPTAKKTTKSKTHTEESATKSEAVAEKSTDNNDSGEKKKKKKTNKEETKITSQQQSQGNDNATKKNLKKKKDVNTSNKKRFNGKSQNTETNTVNSMSDERLKAYGLNPRKFRKQIQFSAGQNPFKNKPSFNNKNKFKNKSN